MIDYVSEAKALLIQSDGEPDLEGAICNKAAALTRLLVESKSQGYCLEKDFVGLIKEYFKSMNQSFMDPSFNKKLFIDSLVNNNFFQLVGSETTFAELEKSLNEKGLTYLEHRTKYDSLYGYYTLSQKRKQNQKIFI
ncbi:Uncharacterised protein [Candidatus Tiddalikarchaeum anstoanum]|nr:Uncharacterised protein [Candidatus Tiddalikarchaeum anstoanum]